MPCSPSIVLKFRLHQALTEILLAKYVKAPHMFVAASGGACSSKKAGRVEPPLAKEPSGLIELGTGQYLPSSLLARASFQCDQLGGLHCVKGNKGVMLLAWFLVLLLVASFSQSLRGRIVAVSQCPSSSLVASFP